jgi:hypothetical protein
MAKVEVTLIPWAGDREADPDNATAFYVESVKVDDVVYGEGQFDSRAILTLESREFARLAIYGPEAKTLFESLDPSEYMIGSNKTRVLLPVNSITIRMPVTA